MNQRDHEATKRTIPPYLFRYYSFPKDPEKIHQIRKIFTDNKLLFSSPAKFNDPFDCKTNVLEFPKSGDELHSLLMKTAKRQYPDWSCQRRKAWVRELEGNKAYLRIHEKVKNTYQTDIDKHGVLCLSEHDESALTPLISLLMWSHYTNGHRGFCLQFATNNDFFEKAEPVWYQLEHPIVNAACMIFPETNNNNAERDKLLKKMMLTKAKCWEYEKEWRLFSGYGANQQHEFPSESLKGVIFGCQIAEENKEKIMEWLSYGDCRPDLYQAKKEGPRLVEGFLPD